MSTYPLYKISLALIIGGIFSPNLLSLTSVQERIIDRAHARADSSFFNHLPSLSELAATGSPQQIIDTAKSSCYYRLIQWFSPADNEKIKQDFLEEWRHIEQNRIELIDKSTYIAAFKEKAARHIVHLTLLACKANIVLKALQAGQTLYLGNNINFQRFLDSCIDIFSNRLKNNITRAHEELDRCTTRYDVDRTIESVKADAIKNTIDSTHQILFYLFNDQKKYDSRSHKIDQSIEKLHARKRVITDRIDRQEREQEIARAEEQRKQAARLEQETRERNQLTQRMQTAIAGKDLHRIAQLIREAQRLGLDHEEFVHVAQEFLSEQRSLARLAASGEAMQNQEEIYVSNSPVEKQLHEQLQRASINIDYVDRLINQAKSQGITAQNSRVVSLAIDCIRNAIIEQIIDAMHSNNMARLTFLVEKALIYRLHKNRTVELAIAVLNSQTSISTSQDPFAHASAPPAPEYTIIECEACYDEFSSQELCICPQSGCHLKFCPNDLKQWIERSKNCPICRKAIHSMQSLKKCENLSCKICRK